MYHLIHIVNDGNGAFGDTPHRILILKHFFCQLCTIKMYFILKMYNETKTLCKNSYSAVSNTL